MSRLFHPQNSFWQPIGKFADVLELSIARLFLSLLVLPLGAATAALYDAAARCVLGGQSGPFVRFWETFKREFKTGALATLLWGGLCAALVALVWAVRARVVFEGATAAAVLAAWFAVLLVPVGALCWMFPLLSRFTFSPAALGPVSLKLALGYLPRTLLIVAAGLAGVMLSVWLLLPMLVLPCLVAMAWVGLMEGVFKRYEPPKDIPEEK